MNGHFRTVHAVRRGKNFVAFDALRELGVKTEVLRSSVWLPAGGCQLPLEAHAPWTMPILGLSAHIQPPCAVHFAPNSKCGRALTECAIVNSYDFRRLRRRRFSMPASLQGTMTSPMDSSRSRGPLPTARRRQPRRVSRRWRPEERAFGGKRRWYAVMILANACRHRHVGRSRLSGPTLA